MNADTRAASQRFLDGIRNPFKFRAFLWTRLPSAWFAGLKIPEATLDRAVVTVPYKWSTKNPFRSTYFACLAMAAEMSTGVLAMAHTQGYKPGISMLVADIKASFHKKATGITRFICEEGERLSSVIQEAVDSGEGREITLTSTGYNSKNETVAIFEVTWSFRQRQSK